MNADKLFPLNYNGWDDIGILQIQLYEVEFTENFGLFTTGDKFDSLFISYDDGYMEGYNDNKVVKKVRFGVVAIPE